MPLHPVLADVTARIVERSQKTRGAYLARTRAAYRQKVERGQLSCTNLAHAFAAMPAGDKILAEGRAAPPSLFAAWRATPPEDMGRRTRLRGHCLAEDHSRSDLDLAIGKHLLADPALFAKALAVAAPVTTASFPHSTPSLNRN